MKCQSMDRNFCAPNQKNAALFVDVDGTIMRCQKYFDEAGESFAHFMALRGFDGASARQRLHLVDHAKTEAEGFERDRFGRSLVECYRTLVKEKRRRFTAEQMRVDELILRSIGMQPFFREPELFPNAGAVLGRAHHNFLMIAVSIGNREAQKFKVRQAGLDPVFDEVIVTPYDDKPEMIRKLLVDWNIDPALSAHIGNSRRSDGSCLAVTNFIYLPLESGWSFDQTRELPESSPFEMFEAKDWREAEEKGLNRLVRRRKALAGRLSTPGGDSGCQH